MSESGSNLDSSSGNQVKDIINAYLERRSTDPNTTPESLISKHPQHAELLRHEFEILKFIDQAHGAFANEPKDASSGSFRDTNHWVHCPHCRCQFEVDTQTEHASVNCSSCGQNVSIYSRQGTRASSDRIGRFELMECLGQGSFGAVWRARDTELDRDVALKVPRRQVMSADEIERVNREARLAARLNHTSIVSVLEIGREEQSVFIVSDLIEGATLRDWSETRPMSFEQIAELVMTIADALHHAHEAGVVHRDLKPANILIDDTGSPHLTDFGLAKSLDEELSMTVDGQILGTPSYMSPEQAGGNADRCTPASDIYGAGVILFELLTGELPFRGNLSVLTQKVLEDDPPSPRQLNRYVPKDLETICLKCLEKSPDSRFRTAEALSEDLQRYLNHQPIEAKPVGVVGRFSRWMRRNRTATRVIVAVLSVLILLAGMTSWFYVHERSKNREISRLLQFIRGGETVRHFESEVADAARTSELRSALMMLAGDESLQPVLSELQSGQSSVDEAQRSAFETHSSREPIQQWCDSQLAKSFESGDREKIFAWFVQDASGLQVARGPLGNGNIGKNYAWRSYFHGGATDFKDLAEYQRRGSQRHLTGVKFSSHFVTRETNQLVMGVSAPVLSEQGTFLGVVGVFLLVPDDPTSNAGAGENL